MIKEQTILIIDDESQIRRILRITLEAENFKVIDADNGRDGLLLAANHNPSLIILDLGLPDRDGSQVLEELRMWSSTPVMILSVRNAEDEIIKALEKGADDYITKPFSPAELTARIKANLRRAQTKEGEPVISNGAITIDLVKHIVLKNNEEVKLTQMEYKLLALFMNNIGKVLTYNLIFKSLWGTPSPENAQSLRVFIGTLRKKIEDSPARPRLILTESGVGYRMKQI
jgi:two-component system, OmpR family, KDP operon response regulator KdpE